MSTSISAKTSSSISVSFTLSPSRNVRTLQLRYIVIPSNITLFRHFSTSLGGSILPAFINSGNTISVTTTANRAVNLTGGCQFIMALNSFRIA